MLPSRRPLSVAPSAVVAAAVAALLAATGCSSESSPPGASGDASFSPERPDTSQEPTEPQESPQAGGGDREEQDRDEQAGETEDAEPAWDTSPSSMAALGDSITQAFDACWVLQECPEASWATGTDPAIDSLSQRLLGSGDGADDHAWNVSETGATVADLPDQVREAAAHDPELVTVLIGANDACANDVASMTSVAEFEDGFSGALDLLRDELPGAEVYVLSLPDLMKLWEQGSDSAIAGMVWGLADICPAMLADPDDDSSASERRRDAVRERVRSYNAVLKEVCEADALCRYDGGAVFRYPFSSDHLSDWDWFHPSREGQAELARLAYEGVTRETEQSDR